MQDHTSVFIARIVDVHDDCVLFSFFFQAEDGIRDLVRSRGLGDVYKRQTLHQWTGNKTDYLTRDGVLEVRPTGQGFGDLYTVKEYSDFIFRFEFKLTPGANNGVGIRTPGTGDAAYEGMEIQILDHFDPIYQPWPVSYTHLTLPTIYSV